MERTLLSWKKVRNMYVVYKHLVGRSSLWEFGVVYSIQSCENKGN